jgi:solute:Na+ symporter, SSS family
VGGSAVFSAAVIAQAIVIAMYVSLSLGYLWYNVIGCAICIVVSLSLQAVLGPPTPRDVTRAA